MRRLCLPLVISLLAACGHKTPLTLPPDTAPAKKNFIQETSAAPFDDSAKGTRA